MSVVAARSRRRVTRTARALGLGAVLALALYFPVLFRGETFVMRDLLTFSRPIRSLAVPLARASGGLPLWNPYFNSGQPYAANPQTGFLHPATALLFALPFDAAFRALVVLPTLLAAAAAFRMLRALGHPHGASTFGALCYGFGGYTLSMTNHLPMAWAACMVPAVLAAVAACARGGRGRAIAGLGLAVGLVALAGEPTILALVPVAGAAAWLDARGRVPRPDDAFRRGLARLAVGGLLGIALGAAVLLPAAGLVAKTARAVGLHADAAGSWSMPPARIADAVAPAVQAGLGEGAARDHWARLYPGHFSPLVHSLYHGLLFALAAGCGLAALVQRRAAWVAVAGVGALLALGAHGPLWPLVTRLPWLSSVRYPEKAVLLVVLSATVAAAHGFEAITARLRRDAWPRGILLALAAVPAAAIALVAVQDALAPDGSVRVLTPRLAAWVAAVGAAHVAAAALLWRARAATRRSSTVLGLLALSALDLAVAARPLLPTRPAAAVAAVPGILQPLVAAPASGPLFDAAVRGARHAVRPPMPALWGIATTLEPDLDSTQLAWSAEASEAVWAALRSDPSQGPHLLRRRGVGAVLQLAPGAEPIDPFTLRSAPGVRDPLQLVRLPAAPPFACVAAVRRVADTGEWSATVGRLGPAALSTALVESADALPGAVAPCDVLPLVLEPGRSVLDVTGAGPQPSFLAVNRTWDEGWSATVDGRPSTLLRAEVSLAGLLVPPGRHRVDLAYADPRVTAGLAVSGAALLVLAALAALSRR